MAATYYAWSRFKTNIDEHGKVGKWFEVGDKVSQADLGVNDAEWNEIIDGGSVREQPYPEGAAATGISPTEYFKSLLVKAGEGNLSAQESKQLASMGVLVEQQPAQDEVAEVNKGGGK